MLFVYFVVAVIIIGARCVYGYCCNHHLYIVYVWLLLHSVVLCGCIVFVQCVFLYLSCVVIHVSLCACICIYVCRCIYVYSIYIHTLLPTIYTDSKRKRYIHIYAGIFIRNFISKCLFHFKSPSFWQQDLIKKKHQHYQNRFNELMSLIT